MKCAFSVAGGFEYFSQNRDESVEVSRLSVSANMHRESYKESYSGKLQHIAIEIGHRKKLRNTKPEFEKFTYNVG